MRWLLLVSIAALSAPMLSTPVRSQPVGRITGIGGIFITSKNPEALSDWYRDVLGLEVKPWGGAMLRYDAPMHPPAVIWAPFAENSDEMAGSSRDFVINLAVDNMDAFVTRLNSKGVRILRRDDTDPNGKFAWLLDPDGTKVELWQPK